MPAPLMLTTWTTVADVERTVLQVMKVQMADLRSEDRERFESTVAKAIVKAEADIIPLLAAKGYSLTALTDWHHRSIVLTDQAVFRTLIAQDALSSVVDTAKIQEFDWRKAISDDKWLPTGSNGLPVPISNDGGGGVDGEDTDGIGGDDLFGGSRIAVGRFRQNNWKFNEDTVF